MGAAAKVSILLPVYNREHFIVEAIESVIAQSYTNWELLISDNCSTDGTSKVAQQYAWQDKRIRYWRNDMNIGSGLNYNKCIAAASGEYIELFGADDIFEPKCLETFVEIFEQNANVVLVTSSRRHIDENGAVIREDRPCNGSQLMLSQEAIASNMRTLTNWIGSPVMFRAKYKGDGFNLSLGIYCDLDYWAQILLNGDLYYVDKMLFNYRVHRLSETTARLNNLEFMPTLLRMAEKYKQFMCDSEQPDKQPYKIVMDKLINLADYATNFLELNYDSFLGELSEHKSNKTVINNASDYAAQIDELKNDLNDFKRISYMSLLHALDLKKERDWLANEYDQLQKAVDHTKSGRGEQKNFIRHNRDIEGMNAQIKALQLRIDELSRELNSVLTSQSWKITAPLRMMKKNLN